MAEDINELKLKALAGIPGALSIPARDIRANGTHYIVLVPVERIEPGDRFPWRAVGTYKGKLAATEGSAEALLLALQKQWPASELDPNGSSTGLPTVAPSN
jgi:hypothetical protein